MLTGTQLFTNLAVAITAVQVTAPLVSTTGLTIATGNHVYFLLDDGVSQEIVKATGVTGQVLTILRGQFGTTARAFVAGVCVKPYLGYEAICELFTQGGCAGGGGVTCVPVALGGSYFPDAVIGVSWQAAASYTNATAITAPIVPAWVTVTVTANMITMTGVPPAGTTDFRVVTIANGCNSSSVVVERTIRICQQIGVAV